MIVKVRLKRTHYPVQYESLIFIDAILQVEQKKLKENIGIFVNPKSGRGKAVKIGVWLTRKLSAGNRSYTLFSSHWPHELAEFSEVWLVGGDGTVNYFLNRYKNNVLPLVLFKGGTGNDIAWKLYGEISLDQHFEIALNASPKPIDAALCNGIIFINSSGIGFDGDVLKSIGTIRWLGGHLGYLAVVIRKIFTFKEMYFTIHADNKKIEEKFLLVIANNSSRTGGGFMVTPNASVNDGKLDMLLCKPLSVWKRLRYLPVIEKGKHLQLPFISYSLVKKVLIEAENEVYAQLDGELIRSKVFDIEILPGKLLVKY